MKAMRVELQVEMELATENGAATFAAALRAVADRILAAPKSLACEGSARGASGAARWTVRSWDAKDLVKCACCGRSVRRAETDITENGVRCRHCIDQGEIEQHWLNVEGNAYDSGYSDGFFSGEWLTR